MGMVISPAVLGQKYYHKHRDDQEWCRYKLKGQVKGVLHMCEKNSEKQKGKRYGDNIIGGEQERV